VGADRRGTSCPGGGVGVGRGPVAELRDGVSGGGVVRGRELTRRQRSGGGGEVEGGGGGGGNGLVGRVSAAGWVGDGVGVKWSHRGCAGRGGWLLACRVGEVARPRTLWGGLVGFAGRSRQGARGGGGLFLVGSDRGTVGRQCEETGWACDGVIVR